MTRRGFSVALAGLVASPVFQSGDPRLVVILRAVAGARLPETLAVATDSPDKLRQGLWELRTYRTDPSQTAALAVRFAGIFPRAGIHPLSGETHGPSLTYLIPFEDLTARERAWTALNADPEWTGACPLFESYRFGLYRAA